MFDNHNIDGFLKILKTNCYRSHLVVIRLYYENKNCKKKCQTFIQNFFVYLLSTLKNVAVKVMPIEGDEKQTNKKMKEWIGEKKRKREIYRRRNC